ncbi:MAG: hypothetical protein RRB13_06075 [bacterium]|nr:hypothetical protein [bacterium]
MKTWLLLFGLLWSGVLWAEPLRPVARPAGEDIRLVEQVWACHIGFGVASDVLNLHDQSRRNRDQAAGWTGLKFSQAGYLGFGCFLREYYFDYHFVDRAFRLNRSVPLDGQSWEAVSYRLDQISAGRSFSLAAHRLYLDLGLGLFSGSYQMTAYQNVVTTDGSLSSQETRGEIGKETGALVQSRLRFHLDRNFFFSYGLSASAGLAELSARLGVNYMVRY